MEDGEFQAVPGDLGNTRPNPSSSNKSKKQISPAKHWCWTLNNHSTSDVSSIKGLDSSIVPVITFQEEIGESGTRHLQGTMSFKNKMRPMSLGLSDKIHWEKMKGTCEEARCYTVKNESRVSDGIRYIRGWEEHKPYVEHIDELYAWQKDICMILEQEPDDREIHWYWEATGGIGKTKFCKYVFTHYDNVVVLGGKASDMKMAIVQYRDKNKKLPKIILIDMPRCTMDYISYQGVEEIKNMFFFSGKYEGGMVCGQPPHMICFANEPPDKEKLSKDRWNIKEII